MNIAELDRIAVELATKSLSKGTFDWQAYLVLKAAQNSTQANAVQTTDIVPESRADDGMSEVITLFAHYADCNRNNSPETLDALQSVTDKLRRVIVEIYHLCGSEKERQIVSEMKGKLP